MWWGKEAMVLPTFSIEVQALRASRRAETRLVFVLAMANSSRTRTRIRRIVHLLIHICESLARRPRYGLRYDVWFSGGRGASCGA
jgi:hypothetical protein